MDGPLFCYAVRPELGFPVSGNEKKKGEPAEDVNGGDEGIDHQARDRDRGRVTGLREEAASYRYPLHSLPHPMKVACPVILLLKSSAFFLTISLDFSNHTGMDHLPPLPLLLLG